jgi:hypothetical protein
MFPPTGKARGRGLLASVLAFASTAAIVPPGQAQSYPPPPSSSAGAASVTYTPMVRPGEQPPARPSAPVAPPVPAPAAVPPPSHAPALAAPPMPPAGPGMPPGWFAPAPGEAAPVYTPVHVPTPAPSPWPAHPSALAPDPVTVTAAATRPRSAPAPRRFGVGLDAGLPDGINLGLVLSPASWARLTAAIGTNSASLGYRGGLTLVPVGWGPSFSFEVGHCNLAPTNGVVRTLFSAPAWVTPYVQEFGYTYFNAHVGFDVPLGGFVVFLRGGYSYIMGTLRAPRAVVVDSTTNTSVTIAQDGQVNASTLSAKLGLLYMFGGS